MKGAEWTSSPVRFIGVAQVKELAKGWDALPARYQMVVATSLAFVICNMDKVSLKPDAASWTCASESQDRRCVCLMS